MVHCSHCMAHAAKNVYDGVILQQIFVAAHQVQQGARLCGRQARHTHRGMQTGGGGVAPGRWVISDGGSG